MKVQVVLLVCCMLGATVQRCMISNAIEAKLMLRQRIFRTDEEHERCRKQYQEEFDNRCRTGRPLGECNRPAKPTYKRSEEVSDDDEDERQIIRKNVYTPKGNNRCARPEDQPRGLPSRDMSSVKKTLSIPRCIAKPTVPTPTPEFNFEDAKFYSPDHEEPKIIIEDKPISPEGGPANAQQVGVITPEPVQETPFRRSTSLSIDRPNPIAEKYPRLAPYFSSVQQLAKQLASKSTKQLVEGKNIVVGEGNSIEGENNIVVGEGNLLH